MGGHSDHMLLPKPLLDKGVRIHANDLVNEHSSLILWLPQQAVPEVRDIMGQCGQLNKSQISVGVN